MLAPWAQVPEKFRVLKAVGLEDVGGFGAEFATQRMVWQSVDINTAGIQQTPAGYLPGFLIR